MLKLTTIAILSLTASSAFAASLGSLHMQAETSLDYLTLSPLDEDNAKGDTLGINLHAELGSKYNGPILALDLSGASLAEDDSALFAMHLAQQFDFGHIGIVSGWLYGDNASAFYGAEGRAAYKNFALTARAIQWDFEQYDNSYEIDANARYKFNDQWAFFYDYSHFKLDDNDINFDDYFAGVEYRPNAQWGIKLGAGEYHPIVDSTGASDVYQKLGFSISYGFGDRLIDPVKIPNFSMF